MGIRCMRRREGVIRTDIFCGNKRVGVGILLKGLLIFAIATTCTTHPGTRTRAWLVGLPLI